LTTAHAALASDPAPPSDAHPAPDRTPASLHERDTKNRHLFRAAVVGVLSGLVAVAFKWSLAECEWARDALLHRLHAAPDSALWGWAILPLIAFTAGSFTGWLVMRYAPDASGSGIPHLKGVLLHLRPMSWRNLIPVKFVGGVLCVGSGLSSGREGPTVQMGAAIAKATADILRVPPRAVPQLISCGAGAGLAAAFNAPLAGFLFVIEELHRELSARTFAGALVAALGASIVARALGGDLPSFEITGYPSIPLAALPAAALLGLLGGLLGVVFNRALVRSSDAALRIRIFPRWAAPGVACATCALAAWWIPDAVGGGHAVAERLLEGQIGWGIAALGVLLVTKFFLTVISYASGAPGGIFAPMLLFGAIVGAILGKLIAQVFPSLAPHQTAFAILGMAAWFAGSVRAPLTAIVLIVEMTGNYQQLLALGVTCITADLVGGWLRDTPLYEALLEADLRQKPVPNRTKELPEPRPVYVGVQRGSALAGATIRASGLPAGCLVVSVERSGREVHPEATLELLPGDHLSILVPDDEPEKAMLVVRLATGL
jgi:CIC family chloride channel protein